MDKAKTFLESLPSRLDFLPGLLSRITLGFIFVQSGWGKLHHLDKVTEFFRALGIPAPGLQAWNFPRSLLEASAEGSAENALGGGLAFHFGRHGNFAGVSMASAQSVASWSEFLSTGQGIGGLVPFASEAAYLR